MAAASANPTPEPRRRLPWLPNGAYFRWTIPILACLTICTLPPLLYLYRFAKRSQSNSNLKTLAFALHNYHDAFGCFPPPSCRADHSWRALVAPYLPDNFEGVADFKGQYRFDERWDGPRNSAVLKTHWFGRTTQYLAIVGPDTMWPAIGQRTLDDVRDGTGNTILVVELPESKIRWLEPGDLVLVGRDLFMQHDQAKRPVNIAGCNVVMADGSLHRLSPKITIEQVQGLLTVNGGEPPPWAIEREEIASKTAKVK